MTTTTQTASDLDRKAAALIATYGDLDADISSSGVTIAADGDGFVLAADMRTNTGRAVFAALLDRLAGPPRKSTPCPYRGMSKEAAFEQLGRDMNAAFAPKRARLVEAG